jgi:hypothetical protein
MGRPEKDRNQEQRRHRIEKRNRAIKQRRRAGLSKAKLYSLQLEASAQEKKAREICSPQEPSPSAS